MKHLKSFNEGWFDKKGTEESKKIESILRDIESVGFSPVMYSYERGYGFDVGTDGGLGTPIEHSNPHTVNQKVPGIKVGDYYVYSHHDGMDDYSFNIFDEEVNEETYGPLVTAWKHARENLHYSRINKGYRKKLGEFIYNLHRGNK